MPEEDERRGVVSRQEGILIDAMLYNGIDVLAERRAHMRELTMARQAAERRCAPGARRGIGEGEQLVEVRERATALRAELARLQAAHRAWLDAHGVRVAQRRTRRQKAPGTIESS